MPMQCSYIAKCLVAVFFLWQVKNEVQPIQEAEAARIRSEVAVFTTRVADYRKTFRTRSFYKYSTGAAKAYPEIDQV